MKTQLTERETMAANSVQTNSNIQGIDPIVIRLKAYFKEIDEYMALAVPYTMEEYAIDLLNAGVTFNELYSPLLKVGINPSERAKHLGISSLNYVVRYGLIELCLRYYVQN